MTNDNNFLLIILIGIILFWIFNINTTENFKKNIHSKNNNNKNNLEHYNDLNNVKYKTAESPLLNTENITDKDLIDKLYSNTISNKLTKSNKSNKSTNSTNSTNSNNSNNSNNSSNSNIKKYSNNQDINNSQQILVKPPTIRDVNTINNKNEQIANQIVSNNKQPMTPGDNPVGYPADAQNNLQSFDMDSYMLLPKDSMPDPKFKKVMPVETRKTLTSGDLLPVDENDKWFQVPNSKFNLMQAVELEIPEIKIGVDTVGQSRKNATYDLRAAPPNPKFVVSPWSNSTIEPDYNTKPLC
jgi:hypothetical protein